jgi:hypothetical protein
LIRGRMRSCKIKKNKNVLEDQKFSLYMEVYIMDQDYRKKFIKSYIKKYFNSYSVIELGLIEYYFRLDNYERVKDLLIKFDKHENTGMLKEVI